jgi:hypothetical protein
MVKIDMYGSRENVHCTLPFTPHGITLVRHGTGSNLIFLKGFFYFLMSSQEPDIRADFVSGSPQTSKVRQNLEVNLSGIRLTSHKE